MLDKLHKDYKPTFKLHFKWEPEEYYKIKMPHPHIPNEKETVQLPMLSESTELGDRAVFYNAIVDIQEQVEFDGTNGPLLYYTFNRCLKGTALNGRILIVLEQQQLIGLQKILLMIVLMSF